MLSKSKEKYIRSLTRKKNRLKTGQCLVEGEKVIKTAGKAVEFTFSRHDTEEFDRLVTTETPQDIAGIANIPTWELKDILNVKTIVILDGVQDPGNVGSIFRSALGFEASVILIESADPTSPKVIRSSVGALFHVPFLTVKREDLFVLDEIKRPFIKLEKRSNAKPLSTLNDRNVALIIGSEGKGIQIDVKAESYFIEHHESLESLNAAHAAVIALHHLYTA